MLRSRKIHVVVCFFILSQLAIALPPADDAQRDFVKHLRRSVVERTLSNGLRVIFYRRGFAPVFAGVVAVRVGGVDEEIGWTGLSHMLEHMAFKGTDTLGTRDYSRERGLLARQERLRNKLDQGEELTRTEREELDEVQTELEALWIPDGLSKEFRIRGATDLNATTSQDMTNYFVSLPRGEFEFWCWLESERLLRPVMRQFYKERDVVMEERRMRYDDDPGGRLYESMLLRAFLVHPYRHPVIGYPFDIRRLTPTMLRSLHGKFYVPENMVIALVGDVNPDRDLPMVERYFGRVPRAAKPEHPQVPQVALDGPQDFTITATASPQLMIAYHKPSYPDPEDAPLSVLFEMLSGSNISPMYELLVKKWKVATSVSHFEAPGSAYPNIVAFSLVPRSGVTNKELRLKFSEVIDSFSEKYLTNERLEIARRALEKEIFDGVQSNVGMARDLASSQLMYGDWSEILQWYSLIRKVSLEDVRRVFETYILHGIPTVGYLETKEEK